MGPLDRKQLCLQGGWRQANSPSGSPTTLQCQTCRPRPTPNAFGGALTAELWARWTGHNFACRVAGGKLIHRQEALQPYNARRAAPDQPRMLSGLL
jgi:hypothetical protein